MMKLMRSGVCRSDDSKIVGFHFDVFQSDYKEIDFSRSHVCRSDDNVSQNLGTIDFQLGQVQKANHWNQLDSSSRFSTSCNVRIHESDILHSDDLGHV